MAQIQSPETYADGQQVTAARLNNQTNGATLLPGAVTDQPAITAGTVATADGLIIHDDSVSALRKATVGDILGSGLPVITGSVTASAGADLVVTPASTFKLDVAGALEADSLNITGNSTTVGTMTVGGLVTFNATSAVKIPVGTTAERPATAVAGQFRYNSTLDTAEVYSGTEWKAAGGIPFDATGGTITTVDGYRIHTFNSSGIFTPNLAREGKVEYLVVGAGGAGVFQAPQGGGAGGGGAVLTGFLTIAKNTSPFTVTVGSGGSGAGTSSTFHTFTANGGSPGVGRTAGASGSGFAGGGPGDGGPGGGGARSAEIAGRATGGGGIGGRGFGSYISGTYNEYGGGGSGPGGSSTAAFNLAFSPEGVWGGGGRNVAPVANSGGGGGGGCTNVTATAGASGVVVIRYRVS
jgi:hypothetical protein